MSRARPAFVMVLIVALAVGSWWLAGAHRSDGPDAPGAANRQPGYYLTDASVEQSDASGRTTLNAHAAHATQAEWTGDIALEELTLHYYPTPGSDWVMTSRSGTLPAGSSTVRLDGEVQLRGASAANASGAIVHTDHLLLDVATHLATTAEPVRIELAPHTLAALGMRADLTHETLRLESAVHGTFAR